MKDIPITKNGRVLTAEEARKEIQRINGAESGQNRRSCSLDWVRQIVRQCREANVRVFVKQLDIDGKLVKDIEKFPEDLQIRQIPWKQVEK